MFTEISGQESVKRKLEFYVKGYRATKRIPHLMFVAEKGCGKTTLARAVARELGKPIVEINCSTIKNMKQFMNAVIYRHVYGRDVTIIFDEASEIPQDVTMSLLTMLNPNAEGINTFDYERSKIKIDFAHQTFLFATSEPHRVFHALNDRMDRIDLEPYSIDDLTKMLARQIKAKISADVLKECVSVVRSNPRSAEKLSENINLYASANNKDLFSMEDWKSLTRTLGILPLGLSQIELQILRLLQDADNVKLSHIAAKTGLTIGAIQRHFENYLLRHSLVRVESNGRALTPEGHAYLAALTA